MKLLLLALATLTLVACGGQPYTLTQPKEFVNNEWNHSIVYNEGCCSPKTELIERFKVNGTLIGDYVKVTSSRTCSGTIQFLNGVPGSDGTYQISCGGQPESGTYRVRESWITLCPNGNPSLCRQFN